ncbi:MAG: outer membrane lipoprotein chaperone LolA [Pseudomonadota bacterium]
MNSAFRRAIGVLATAVLLSVGLVARAADGEGTNSGDEVPATGVDRLRAYIVAGEVYHADFVQSVYSESGELVRESSGDVSIAPPNRFRWIYQVPFPQLIVSNGEQLYLYDEDLAQVTVYDSNSALKSSPTMLFRDPESLERSFEIRSLESNDGYAWVELRPRDEDADFEAVYVALDSSGMRVLEMRDKLGQATQIRFDHLQVTTSVNDALFEFEIPDGTDVIRP